MLRTIPKEDLYGSSSKYYEQKREQQANQSEAMNENRENGSAKNRAIDQNLEAKRYHVIHDLQRIAAERHVLPV